QTRSEIRAGKIPRFHDLSVSFDVAGGTDRERLQERIARAEILKWVAEDKRIQGYMKLLGSKKYGYTDWFFEPFDYGEVPELTKTRLLDVGTYVTKNDQKEIIKEFPTLKKKIKGKAFGLTASPYFLDLIDSAEGRKLILIHELLHAMYAADRPDIEKSIRRFIGEIQEDGASHPLKAGMESMIFQSIFLDNLLHAWAFGEGFEEDVRQIIQAKYGTLDHIQKSIQKFMRQDANSREEWRWRLENARALYRFFLPYDLLNRPPPEDEEKATLLLARRFFKTQNLYNHFVRTRRSVRRMLQKMRDNEFPSIEEFQKTFTWLQIPARAEIRSDREADPWDRLAKLREGIQRLREKFIRKKTSGLVLLRTALKLYRSYMLLEKNRPSSNPDLFKASLDLHGEQLNSLTRSLMKQESEFVVKQLGLVGASVGILLSYLLERDHILGLIAGGTAGFVLGTVGGAMIFLFRLRRMYLSHQIRRDSDVTIHPGQREPEDSEADPTHPSRSEVRVGESNDDETKSRARLPMKPLKLIKPSMFQNPEFLKELFTSPDSPLAEREKKLLDLRYGLFGYDDAHTYEDIARLIADKTYTNVYIEVSGELKVAERKAREFWRSFHEKTRSEVRNSRLDENPLEGKEIWDEIVRLNSERQRILDSNAEGQEENLWRMQLRINRLLSRVRTPVVAIGDLHGSLDGLKEIMSLAKQDKVIVQIGDRIDRGPHSKEVDEEIRRLQTLARRESKGYLLGLAGNHELMLLLGVLGNDDRLLHQWVVNLSEKKYQEIKKIWDSLTESTADLRQTLRRHAYYAPLIENMWRDIRRGDLLAAVAFQGRLFTHAGLTGDLAGQLESEIIRSRGEDPSQWSMEEIASKVTNEQLAEYINVVFWRAFRDARKAILEDRDPRLAFRHVIFTKGGIFLNRNVMQEPVAKRRLQVFGHTPGNRITGSSDGSLLNIDVGIFLGSRA
ncbi:MAG TPA: metallophosphoesterase, partial [bacterium]|nr:metallophosphoesterase [bacterium]